MELLQLSMPEFLDLNTNSFSPSSFLETAIQGFYKAETQQARKACWNWLGLFIGDPGGSRIRVLGAPRLRKVVWEGLFLRRHLWKPSLDVGQVLDSLNSEHQIPSGSSKP